MDVPKPPDDHDLKNIIDKLANFVARNGPDFEEMTKQKQKDNPRFSFLFGGEFYNYYQYKVNSEKNSGGPIVPLMSVTEAPPPNFSEQNPVESIMAMAQQKVIVHQQAMTQQALHSAPWQQIQQTNQQLSQLQSQLGQQQQATQEQVKQSEQNLAAQYASLIQQQQVQIEDAVNHARDQRLEVLSKDCDLQIKDLDDLVYPIIHSCTKDAISNGKNWIFTHNNSQKHGEFISQYLLKRITCKHASFELRLHLIYLINDILHHCIRKNADDLKNSLEKIVVPVFCSAHVDSSTDKQQKLAKLLNLWERNKYFDVKVIEQMKDPASAMATYQANLITENAPVLAQITQGINDRYGQLQKQHQDFVNHLNVQLTQTQKQIQTLLQQQASAPGNPPPTSSAGAAPIASQGPPVLPGSQPSVSVQGPPPGLQSSSQASAGLASGQQPQGAPPFGRDMNQRQPPPGLPNTSGPPPGAAVNVPTSAPPQIGGPAPLGSGPPPGEAGMGGGANLPAGIPSGPPPNMTGPPPGITNGHPLGMGMPPNMSGPPPLMGSGPPPQGQGQGPPPGMGMPPSGPGGPPHFPPNFNPAHPPPNFNQPPPGFGPPPVRGQFPPEFPPPGQGQPPVVQDYNHGQAPPPPLPMLPDLSKPPPGFPPLPPPAPAESDLMPTVPYFELPAGLLAPLVKLEDSEYKPIDPKDIRLPPPMPPSERLLAAVEAFYSPPSHERPRDSEGWEKLGLFEFFKAKQKAKKIKEEIKSSRGEYTRSPVRGRSRSRSRSRSPRRRRSRSYSRSRSRSPPPYSRRRSRSPSPSPAGRRRRSPSRSPSPPVYGSEPYFTANTESRLGMENKGHQLLKKMGWGGAGLGAKEQGIVDPIQQGEVREKMDMYKGVGINVNDPFEQFRKNKSAGFIQRMRARDEAIAQAAVKGEKVVEETEEEK